MRIRLKQKFEWRRSLGHGSSVASIKAGDYEVGVDIHPEAAIAALDAGAAIKLRGKDSHETKVARLVK